MLYEFPPAGFVKVNFIDLLEGSEDVEEAPESSLRFTPTDFGVGGVEGVVGVEGLAGDDNIGLFGKP